MDDALRGSYQELLDRGWSVAAVAAAAGVHRRSLRRWLSGTGQLRAALRPLTDDDLLATALAATATGSRFSVPLDVIRDRVNPQLLRLAADGYPIQTFSRATGIPILVLGRLADHADHGSTQAAYLAALLSDVTPHLHQYAPSALTAQAAAHVADLHAQGFTMKQIAAAAGVPRATLFRVHSGRRTARDVPEALLGVTPEQVRRRSRRTSAEPVRAHLAGLLRTVTLPAAARAAQLPVGRLQHILDPETMWVDQRDADAVLSLRQGTPGRAMVAADLSWQRIESLMALGHSTSTLTRLLGSNVTNRGAPLITAARAHRIRGVYRTLAMTPGQSVKARQFAASRGYEPPLAWDDPGTLEWPPGMHRPRSGPR